VAHLQAQLALATSEITRLRETFAIAAAAASTSTNNTAAAAPGALLMAALLPCSPSTQADPTSLNPAAATGTPEELPPQQLQPAAPESVESRQPPSPVSCEHSPPLLL